MGIIIETERTILRHMLPSDVDGMFELDADAEVHRYLGNKPISNRHQALETVNWVIKQYNDFGIGRWALINKETNAFMGWCGLKWITEPTNGHCNYYDLGYRLIKRYWGQGFAAEAALVCRNYAFDNLKTDVLYAAANCDNVASNKILKKIGMQANGHFYYEDIRCLWYKMEKGFYEEMRLQREKS